MCGEIADDCYDLAEDEMFFDPNFDDTWFGPSWRSRQAAPRRDRIASIDEFPLVGDS